MGERFDVALEDASCAWVPYATWNARPECDSRITNIHTRTVTPAMVVSNSPKSTSASAPGGWVCGTNTSLVTSPSSTRRRATYRETVTSDRDAPCSAIQRAANPPGGVPLLLRHLLVPDEPAVDDLDPRVDRRPGRFGYTFRGERTAETSAWRTARRCTP